MIDIIIVTYQALEKLKLCLESVQQHTPAGTYQLTIINNASYDGTYDFLNRFKKSHNQTRVVHCSENLGFCGGANLALKLTKNKYIVLLDDDAEVESDWLLKLMDQCKAKKDVGIVGCKIVKVNNVIHSADYSINPLQLMGEAELDRGQRDYIKECDAIIGTCWLMTRKVVEKVGFFDEAFFPAQHEDADYCIRARLAGFKIIYNGQVKIIHHNLYRDGDRFRLNLKYFKAKWRSHLKMFPLVDSHPVDKHLAKGMYYLRTQNFNKAHDEFLKTERYEDIYVDRLLMGKALVGKGDYKKANEEYKRALYFNPKNRRLMYEIMLLSRKSGLIKDAVEDSKKILDLIAEEKELELL